MTVKQMIANPLSIPSAVSIELIGFGEMPAEALTEALSRAEGFDFEREEEGK